MQDSLHNFSTNFTILICCFCVQFDVFSHLNTDDTVRRIKEILSQYSISQRLFGEAVLGLSQVRTLYTVYSVAFSQRLFGEAVLGLSQVRTLYTVYSATF
jgi:hypothetical protein